MDKKYIGLVIGLGFTALVAGLLIRGHTATSETPVAFAWETQPGLFICDTAPKWFRPGNAQFEKHLDYLKAHNASYASVEVGHCDLCELVDEGTGEKVPVPCKVGHVAADLLTIDYAGFGDIEEEGRCVYSSAIAKRKVATAADWTTIFVPAKVLSPSFFDDAEFGEVPPSPPPDAESLVGVHEAGHCLWGLEHNLGPTIGCGWRLNPKTGHVMNPNLLKAGWNDEGISPPAWK